MWNWIGKGDLEGDEEEEISSRKKIIFNKKVKKNKGNLIL